MSARHRLLLILATVGAVKVAAVGILLGVSLQSACIAFAICGIMVAIFQTDALGAGEATNRTDGNSDG